MLRSTDVTALAVLAIVSAVFGAFVVLATVVGTSGALATTSHNCRSALA